MQSGYVLSHEALHRVAQDVNSLCAPYSSDCDLKDLEKWRNFPINSKLQIDDLMSNRPLNEILVRIINL